MDGPNKKPFDIRSFLATAGPGRRVVALKAKAVAFTQGQPADSVFFLQSGRADLTVVSKRGKEATVTLLAAEDIPHINGDGPHSLLDAQNRKERDASRSS